MEGYGEVRRSTEDSVLFDFLITLRVLQTVLLVVNRLKMLGNT